MLLLAFHATTYGDKIPQNNLTNYHPELFQDGTTLKDLMFGAFEILFRKKSNHQTRSKPPGRQASNEQWIMKNLSQPSFGHVTALAVKLIRSMDPC